MARSATKAPSKALLAVLDELYAGNVVDLPPILLSEAREWDLPLTHWQGSHRLTPPQEPWQRSSLAEQLQLPLDAIGLWPLCDSSNSRVLESPHLVLGLAEAQWAGRGRQGRPWHSPFGLHLYLSLRVSPPKESLGVFPLVAALGIWKVLSPWVPELWVKWPNDLWIGQQKLAGVLLEGRYRAEHQDWVLGLGLNVGKDPGLPPTAISLADTSWQGQRRDLLCKIWAQWQQDFPQLTRHGFAPFRERWWQADRLRGQAVYVEQGNQAQVWQVLDLENDGRLRVGNGQEVRLLQSAQLRLRPLP